MFHPIEYVKHNPVVGGIGVFLVGLALLYFLGFFKSSGGDGGQSAYYAATVADAQSGNQLQEAYVAAAAQTAQTQISADAYTQVQTKWADTQLGITRDNNAVAPQLAAYGVQSGIVSGLTQVASLPPVVETKKNSGFFGIGGSTKTTVTPSPLATSASDALANLLHEMELNSVH